MRGEAAGVTSHSAWADVLLIAAYRAGAGGESPERLRKRMANPGQPTISLGASGDAVKRLERALRRTPNEGLAVDGVFGAQLENAVKEFQQGAGLTVDGIVGPATWAALPDGGPMPILQEGSTGPVVSSFQTLLTNGAPGQWITTPQGIDGDFGPHTKRPLSRFKLGAASRRTGSSATRPGPFRFMPRAPLLRPRWACSS